jgi:uncharacterized protein YabN with tetrapyrrole methylase and pyrophosphatase domain
MKPKPASPRPAIQDLLDLMARLRAPDGCPWDREQDHQSLRYHAVEEVYELLDAIEAGDDHEMTEELGDLLLQVVFHCQLGSERLAFDFETVCRMIADKLIRRHPHVFGEAKVDTVDGVWAQWEQIKHAEKKGTRHERPSILDGVPARLPALLRAEKVVKKARKGGLAPDPLTKPARRPRTRQALGRELFALAEYAQRKGWCAEDLLRAEVRRREAALRRREKRTA